MVVEEDGGWNPRYNGDSSPLELVEELPKFSLTTENKEDSMRCHGRQKRMLWRFGADRV